VKAQGKTEEERYQKKGKNGKQKRRACRFAGSIVCSMRRFHTLPPAATSPGNIKIRQLP
jgi:hypothetical protein